MENGTGTTNGEGVPSMRNSGDCVTLTKAAAIAESSVSAVKLYPEEYSCNM